jgi:cell division protein FtsL
LLEAKQISHAYSDYNYKPRPIVKPRPKVKRANMFIAKIVVVSGVLLAVLTGLLLTATHAQITYKTDNIIQLKREISDLHNANERLKLEIARLKSLDRVEMIATTELGMIQPGINEIEYIAFEDTDTQADLTEQGALGEESTAAVEVASGKKFHPIILVVNKLVIDHVLPKISPEE